MTVFTHRKSEEGGNYHTFFPRNSILEDEWTLNRIHLGLNENGATSRSQNGCSDYGPSRVVTKYCSSVLRCQNSSINRSRDGPTLEPARLERKWL